MSVRALNFRFWPRLACHTMQLVGSCRRLIVVRLKNALALRDRLLAQPEADFDARFD